jgi:hypothetical protein
MMSTQLIGDETIPQKVRAIRQALQSLEDATSRQPAGPISAADITNASERFSLWAGNLGALREPTSKLSLERRLLDAPDIRKQICQQLDYMTEGVSDCMFKIISSNSII